jgi:carbon monoxide dehydrogenase subunit G
MIRVAGEFTTPITPADLMARNRQPDFLAAVPTLRQVTVDDEGRIQAQFTPRTPLGRMPLATTITTRNADERSTEVRVRAHRGQHTVDVDLQIEFDRSDAITRVSWTAQVRLGGTAASVGQRVGPSLAYSAIDEVLQQLAQAR